ncbi:DUF3291 domain-containing protein [Parasedimentitalea maritima]|uniref:DUF3291 domain-containing protein n=1 Tax=Parasedimentitalea maritima TaxID=2578117 RepID=A0ABY2UWI7_9RHOB|nr:DUF3291 domain-containing protein [Zongyanglinia marina]TLP66970.1 DUF3291 domain-containing protein [Zongyanglinia marina]
MRLALYTFGMFIRPSEDPENDGFHALNDPVFETLDHASGLIARSGYASDPGPEPWGQEVYPKFDEERGDGFSPATLSLWTDLESLSSFTYFGLHATALARGREWFETPRWPPLVLWWHKGGEYPQWVDGVAKLEYLHEHGSSPAAFTFKTPFDPDGTPTKLDKKKVQRAQAKA